MPTSPHVCAVAVAVGKSYRADGLFRHGNCGQIAATSGGGDKTVNFKGSDFLPAAPSIEFTKTAVVADGTLDAAGDIINYTITVLNDGNVALIETAVDDQVESYGLVDLSNMSPNDDGTLDVGETWTYTTSYMVTQADIDNQGGGDDLIDNVATATFTDPTGTPADDNDNASVPIGNNEDPRSNPAIVVGADKGRNSMPYVMVLEKGTGKVLSKFLAYESSYRGGVRVAAGDLTGDGIDEIITAPGRVHVPEVRVFSQDGTELTQFRFMAYAASFIGGVQVGVGDVDGDGKNDIVTIPTDNAAAEVKVFRNKYDSSSPGDDPISNTPYRSFLAFPSSFIGGGVVRVADMGSFSGGSFIDTADGKGEIIVGNGPGMRSTVKVFEATSTTPKLVRTFLPFSSSFRGGVSIDLGPINGDSIPDLIVATGNGGGSLVEVRDGRSGALLKSFAAYTESSRNSPVRVAVTEEDEIFTAQGTDGKTRHIRCFEALSGALV